MFEAHGRDLYMTKGDYGIPIILHLAVPCAECGGELKSDDLIRVELCRCGKTVVAKETDYGSLDMMDGLMVLELTEAESALFRVGLYSWRVLLVRDGVTRNILLEGNLEVVP